MLTGLTDGEHVSQVRPIKVVPVTFAEAIRKEGWLPRLVDWHPQVANGLLCLCEKEAHTGRGRAKRW